MAGGEMKELWLLHGVNLDMLGARPAEHYGSRHAGRAGGARRRPRRRARLHRALLSDEPRGRARGEAPRARPRAARRDRHQPRRLDALQLRDPRRPGARRGAGGRGAPVGRRRARGVAPALGDRRPGDGTRERQGGRRVSRGRRRPRGGHATLRPRGSAPRGRTAERRDTCLRRRRERAREHGEWRRRPPGGAGDPGRKAARPAKNGGATRRRTGSAACATSWPRAVSTPCWSPTTPTCATSRASPARTRCWSSARDAGPDLQRLALLGADAPRRCRSRSGSRRRTRLLVDSLAALRRELGVGAALGFQGAQPELRGLSACCVAATVAVCATCGDGA